MKTEYLKNSPLNTAKFKYLEETIQQNGEEKESNKECYYKLYKLYFMTQNNTEYNCKIYTYHIIFTVTWLESHEAECFPLSWHTICTNLRLQLVNKSE